MTRSQTIYFPHSLGIFYTAITQHLGFPNYGDEYKLMGLSSYGSDNHKDKIYNLFDDLSCKFKLKLKYFNHVNNKFNLDFYDNYPLIGKLFNEKVNEILGEPREKDDEITQHHKDLAKSAQTVYEEIFFKILNNLYQKTQNENLCLSGGCAQNSVANGKILSNTKFKNIYVSSASGDSGGAIGAVTYYLSTKKIFLDKEEGSFYGPNFTLNQIEQSIDNNKENLRNIKKIYFDSEEKLLDLVCNEILNKKIVGWFQGKMEWGPRALGNRSIICDPRRSDMKNILNLKIKRRESFRPFAPSILIEEVSNWFEQKGEVPFMMQVFQILKDKRSLIPAVTHVDGSGRLQTVSEKTNPRYYYLIKEFFKLTNVPMLLNTSFNENEPVVCKPEEALETFLRTKMDILVMGNWVITRKV